MSADMFLLSKRGQIKPEFIPYQAATPICLIAAFADSLTLAKTPTDNYRTYMNYARTAKFSTYLVESPAASLSSLDPSLKYELMHKLSRHYTILSAYRVTLKINLISNIKVPGK
jgi:hypothetical protein